MTKFTTSFVIAMLLVSSLSAFPTGRKLPIAPIRPPPRSDRSRPRQPVEPRPTPKPHTSPIVTPKAKSTPPESVTAVTTNRKQSGKKSEASKSGDDKSKSREDAAPSESDKKDSPLKEPLTEKLTETVTSVTPPSPSKAGTNGSFEGFFSWPIHLGR